MPRASMNLVTVGSDCGADVLLRKLRTSRASLGCRNARWHRCRVTMTPVPLQCQIVACSAIAVPKQCHCSANESLGTSETPRWPSSRRFQPAQLARIGGKPQVSAGPFSPAVALHHFLFCNSLSRRTKLAATRRRASRVLALFYRDLAHGAADSFGLLFQTRDAPFGPKSLSLAQTSLKFRTRPFCVRNL